MNSPIAQPLPQDLGFSGVLHTVRIPYVCLHFVFQVHSLRQLVFFLTKSLIRYFCSPVWVQMLCCGLILTSFAHVVGHPKCVNVESVREK
jgi:hypothetical protein